MPRHDDADDDTPIRSSTVKPDHSPLDLWMWIAFPIALATLVVVVGVLSYRAGRKSGTQDNKEVITGGGVRQNANFNRDVPLSEEANAQCPSCGKQWRISEEYRNNPSQFIREEMCPRCQTFFKVHFLYMAKDPNNTPKPPPIGIPNIVIDDR